MSYIGIEVHWVGRMCFNTKELFNFSRQRGIQIIEITRIKPIYKSKLAPRRIEYPSKLALNFLEQKSLVIYKKNVPMSSPHKIQL